MRHDQSGDDVKAAASRRRAVPDREERQPTVGELVQIIKDLIPEKWTYRPLVKNPAKRREAIYGNF